MKLMGKLMGRIAYYFHEDILYIFIIYPNDLLKLSNVE